MSLNRGYNRYRGSREGINRRQDYLAWKQKVLLAHIKANYYAGQDKIHLSIAATIPSRQNRKAEWHGNKTICSKL